MARNINAQNLICVRLLQIRRHLSTCNNCKAAQKTLDLSAMCEWTQLALVEVAMKWDRNIPGRLAARNSKREYIFPCPDPSAHGPVYALTAEAVMVTDHAESLF